MLLHACAFFHSRDEEDEVLLPFVKEGIEACDKILHLIDTERRDERRRSMALTGIDVVAAERAG
jgi:MEDS: MEthanogen/methylotroph, DcmR Sensory domain